MELFRHLQDSSDRVASHGERVLILMDEQDRAREERFREMERRADALNAAFDELFARLKSNTAIDRGMKGQGVPVEATVGLCAGSVAEAATASRRSNP